MENAFCIWLNGTSGSGKTTLAGLLAHELAQAGFSAEALDEEAIRRNLSMSNEMPDAQVVKFAAYMAETLVKHGVAAVVSVCCPDDSIRKDNRNRIGRFVEIFLDCPEEIASDRSHAEPGDPIQKTDTADIIVPTGGESPQDSLQRILAGLQMLGMLQPLGEQGYSDDEAELIKKRLSDLGYM